MRMAGWCISRSFGVALVLLGAGAGAAPVAADSSSRDLAAYYDRQMALVAGRAFAWRGNGVLKPVPGPAVQVGVGDDAYYTLSPAGDLLRFSADLRQKTRLKSRIKAFAAGASGVLAIDAGNRLWRLARGDRTAVPIASNVASAAVGDGANYYVSLDGGLFVRGKAHRGQYGDGRLRSTHMFIRTASNVARITAHTGHAILLTRTGAVLGTGGNIYGPVGIHGLGDKADRWSRIMAGARAIATGSTHSFAIRRDGTLMGWGRAYGPKPKAVLRRVRAVAAGTSTVIAFGTDGTLWQWRAGAKPRRKRIPVR